MTTTNSIEYIDALDRLYTYYNLKSDYQESKLNLILKKKKEEKDQGIKKQENKIKRELLTTKPKCINCNRPVGTLFYNNYNEKLYARNLIAICGDKQDPCNLNINILMGNCSSNKEDIKEIETLITNIKNDIICDKNNVMFGYISKESALTNFENFKKDISTLTDQLKASENANIHDNPNIQMVELEVNIIIKKIKSLMVSFNKTNNTQLIIDSIEIYKNELIPKLGILMNIKYKYNFVEILDKTKSNKLSQYKLFQFNDSIESFETCYGKTKVVSFKYNPGFYNITKNKTKNQKDLKLEGDVSTPTKVSEQYINNLLQSKNPTQKQRKEIKTKEPKTDITENKTKKQKLKKDPKPDGDVSTSAQESAINLKKMLQSQKTLKVKPKKKIKFVIVNPNETNIAEPDNTSLINDIFGPDSDNNDNNIYINDDDLNNEILKNAEHTNDDF